MMILQDLINEFNKHQDEILGEFRKGLKKTRGSYSFGHNNTGETSRDLEMTNGRITGDAVVWDINSKGGSYLQKGGVPKITFGSKNERPNPYITAIEQWIGKKYGIYGQEAKRKAFAIAREAEKRGNVVKHTGWVDDIRQEVINTSTHYLAKTFKMTVDMDLSKLPKEVTTIKNI
tara:strand:+ start:4283 stop:4807 length:525 start_codon:yes stop_codon:yes gene_type:complete